LSSIIGALKCALQTQPPMPYELYKAHGYTDIVYWPAAPLTETLSARTYETYETDKRKYAKYKSAVYYAIARGVFAEKTGIVHERSYTMYSAYYIVLFWVAKLVELFLCGTFVCFLFIMPVIPA